jgi:hypothetical protein
VSLDWQTPVALAIVLGVLAVALRAPLASLWAGACRRPKAQSAVGPAPSGCAGCASSGACAKQAFMQAAGARRESR